MSAITLIDEDRQWFKSRQGLNYPESPREESFCAHAVAQTETLYVPDTHEDERFAGNPAVLDDPNVRAYAGAQIHAPDGATIGTLCAIDNRPRELSEDDLQALEDLARMAEQEIAALTGHHRPADRPGQPAWPGDPGRADAVGGRADEVPGRAAVHRR